MGWFAIACICGFLGYRCWRLTSNWLASRDIADAEIIYAIIASGIVFAFLVLWASGSLLSLVLGIGVGFLGYWGWRSLSNWLLRKFQIRSGYAGGISAAIEFTIVIAVLALWAIWSQDARTSVADVLQRGSVVRFLLGLIPGIGVGFLGRWGQQSISDRPGRKHQITSDNAETLSGVIGFAIVLAGLVLWAIGSQDARTPGQVADALQRGSVARLLLGLILGVGVAFIAAQRSRVQSSNGGTTQNPAPLAPNGQTMSSSAPLAAGDSTDLTADTDSAQVKPAPASAAANASAPERNGVSSGDGSKGDLPISLIVSTAFGIVILALVAPHLDDWFHRLTGFKSSYIELQLASSSTHKISVSEGAEVLLSTDSLSYLGLYDTKIAQDIDYLTKYGEEVPKRDEIVAAANKLLPTFKTIFGPITKCVQAAIDHDWLTFDSARQMLRPTADAAQRIIFAEKTLDDSGELNAKYDQFWRSVLELPSVVASSVKEPECTGVPVTQYTHGPAGSSPDLFPKIRDYEKIPYLHVAAALLVSFMGDNDKALRILQKAEPKLDFKDYFFLLLKARLSYYNGKPGDIWQTYLGPLDEMRSMARNHIDVLEKKNQECTTPDNTILICRDLVAELQAKNYAAYFIAEDLARGSDYVGPYVVRLQEYGEDMKRVINEPVSNNTRHKGFYQILGQGLYKRYLPIKYAVLDTYAYATLVLEARRKPGPDYDVIRNKVIPMLRETSDTLKSLFENEAKVERVRLYQVRVGEAHLASAREFVGE